MNQFPDLFDEPTPEHDLVADALRRELRGMSVPYDPQRADEMIAAATSGNRGRLSRLAAPLATAAAVLAVGAGVAVFAATGGTDSALPPGGHPHRPTPTVTTHAGYGSVECVYAHAERVRLAPQPSLSMSPLRPRTARIAPRTVSAQPPVRRHRPAYGPVPGPAQTVTCSNDGSLAPLPAPAVSCAAVGIAHNRALPRRLPARLRCPVAANGEGSAAAPVPSSAPALTVSGSGYAPPPVHPRPLTTTVRITG